MRINNNFNVLPFYDSLQKQNSKKWYSFGQHYPLICPNNKLLPFQFVTNEELTITGNIEAVNVTTGQTTDLGIKPGVMLGTQPGAQYYIVKLAETAINKSLEGLHYLQINTNKGYIYSEEFVFTDSYSECVRLEYWNEDTLNFTSGEINFDDDFKFVMYISSTIGKPEYEFEEELTKRLGYKFIESQTSNKIYKFNFLAPEYICDAMRLVRMCDYIKLTTKYDTYNALSFSYEPKWQNNGDLAAVDVEFDTDCIIQKLESFNRRVKESFYNALLSEIEEPVLFSTDVVAQYYTEFSSTSYINGKLIRQLDAMSADELLNSLASIVLPVDNQSDNAQVAKKAFLSDIINKLIPKVDMSTYLLKAIWDESWELRTDSKGQRYIFGKLPVVTQYGITMYADGGNIDLPSLYAGLPIDGKTIYWDNGILKALGGGGVADSVAWGNISGKPLWITDAKPIYTYSEIQGTPDLTKYALKTDIPSLSGYATEQWVIGQNYVNSTSLANELKKYVSIDSDESINGLKNFKKGLQIDGLGISKSQDDVIYLDANLVVRGGITMYADNTVDIPSILDSLPLASTTNKGIASFDGEYFSVSNGKVTLLEGNVGLNETELAAYLSNNKYATQSWVQSLGYATSSDLDSRINALINGAPAAYDTLKEIADVLAGNVDSIGDIITTLGTKWTQDNAKIANWDAAYSWGNHASVGYALKSYVDTEFAKYVTLATAQTISGEKNFTGGLKVNGSPIVYDATNKYWKLEGDLLVTGGVTMYANEGTYTPSTIMDSLLYDDTTLGINSEGKLYVKGGSGGGLDITALQNYLTLNSYLNVTEGDGRYLKLSGGTMTGDIILTNNRYIKQSGEGNYALLGVETNKVIVASPDYPTYIRGTGLYFNSQTIWHSGNLTASSLGLGNVTNIAASAYLTALSSNTTNAVSITVGGTTKNITAATMKSSLGLGSNAYSSTAYLPSASYTAADVLAKLKTVDGSGSGLDADLLDGHNSSYFIGQHYNSESVNANNALSNHVTHEYRWSNIPSGSIGSLLDLSYSVDWRWQLFASIGDGLYSRFFTGGTTWGEWKKIAFTDSNVASATKATRSRYLETLYSDGSYWYGDLYKLYAQWATDNTNYLDIKIDGYYTRVDVAKKLNTARTIWGQSFDGTGNISGNMSGVGVINSFIKPTLGTSSVAYLHMTNFTSTLYDGVHIYVANQDNSNTLRPLVLQNGYGNVGIGVDTPSQKLHVNGNLKCNIIYGTNLYANTGGEGLYISGSGIYYHNSSSSWMSDLMYFTSGGNVGVGTANPTQKLHIVGNELVEGSISVTNGVYGNYWSIRDTADNPYYRLYQGGVTWYIQATGGNFYLGSTYNKSLRIDVNGNVLAIGGITMYSDKRKKTILNHVELSLKQIANAPLVEHYYNGDDKKTIHVGSIAQYWSGLNDWFCKLDNEGYYTMEIQNAALASAISVARELDRYETKTDKKIKQLKKRICQLEEEVERLKSE